MKNMVKVNGQDLLPSSLLALPITDNNKRSSDMENEIFRILTKVRNDELSRIDAIEQLLRLFNVSGRSELVCAHCGSSNIDKHGGYGIYCLECHGEL